MADWTPAQISASLWMWLDVDDASTVTLSGSNITRIDDKAGSGRYAGTVSADPTRVTGVQNGRAVMRCNAQQLQSSTQVSFGDASMFAVFWTGPDRTDYERVIDHEYSAGFYFGREGTSTKFGGGFLSATNTGLTVADNTWLLLAMRREGTSVKTWSNGDWANAASGTYSGTATTTAYVGFGGFHNGQVAQRSVNIDIGEVIVASASLSDANRQRVEGYLCWRWGLQTSMPENHPYRGVAPVVPPLSTDRLNNRTYARISRRGETG